MKKTLTVNLAGSVFHIDEDAYKLLDDYLSSLRFCFDTQSSGDEIVNDMEARIAELFMEMISDLSSQVITIAHVEKVIVQMGTPEEFAESTSEAAGEDKTARASHARKRLFRNPDDKILGGVISGLALYFGWNVTPFRLLTLVVLVCGVGMLIPIYLICWLIMPEAKTAADKLSMRGEAVTVENIGKTVTDGFQKVANDVNDYVVSGKPRSFFRKLLDMIMAIVGFLVKACFVLLLIICSPILIALSVVFIVLIALVLSLMLGSGTLLFSILPPNILDWPLLATHPTLLLSASTTGIMIIGIPVFVLVYMLLRQLFSWSPLGTGIKWTLLILWVVAIILFIYLNVVNGYLFVV